MTPERWRRAALLTLVAATVVVAGQTEGNEGETNTTQFLNTSDLTTRLPSTSDLTTIKSGNQSMVTTTATGEGQSEETTTTTTTSVETSPTASTNTTTEGEAGGAITDTTTEGVATDTTTEGVATDTTTEGVVTDTTTEGVATDTTTEGAANDTTTTISTTTEPGPTTHTTTIPTTTTTSELECGVNAALVEGRCVCSTSWTHDPAGPGSSCPCPDLCLGLACPSGSSCHHLTCNYVTCSCPDSFIFNPLTNTCESPCRYYGNAICGLGSNMVCQDSPEEEGWYSCRCAAGYTTINGTCQDVNECTSTSAGPCSSNEQCVNEPGSYKCVCRPGYLRHPDDTCVNVNECLNPALHDCDHICEDAQPPTFFNCSCFNGFTWDEKQRKCLLDNATRGCECADRGRSVCYKPPDGAQECHPRPGYRMVNGTFLDVDECGDKAGVRAWCGKGGVCVEGVGRSVCQCADGYTHDTLSYGECVGVECVEGMELSGSHCQDPCTTICAPPLTCGLNSAMKTECRCQSRCQDLLQSGDTTSSVYHGSLIVTTTSKALVNTWRLLKALETCLGQRTVEITSIDEMRKWKRSVPQLTYQKVQFLVSTQQPNMAEEVAEVLKKRCETPLNEKFTMCVLPGGLVVKEDSITVQDKNPCEEAPCPGDLFTCQRWTNTSGRFSCVCKTGFVQVHVEGAPGFCQDIDECRGNASTCNEGYDCINTPGSFVCRSKSVPEEQRAKAEREMAISFGVLFFLAVFITIGLGYLLMKKNKSTRELVPMSTTTTGFDNESYHK